VTDMTMTDAQFTLLITTITGLVSTLATFAYNLYRENRNRKWDRENRELARTELLRRIDENTEVSVKAFREANDVNAKIAALTQQFYEAVPQRIEGEPTPNVLKRVDENTQEAVQILREAKDDGSQHEGRQG
jgi:hypothetical protein